MKIITLGKKGSLTEFVIIGNSDDARVLVESVTTYPVSDTDNGVRGRGSNSDIVKIERLICAADSTNAAAPDTGRAPRRILPLATAQRDGLQCGRAWTCTLADVDSNSLPPELEGDLICYVYG